MKPKREGIVYSTNPDFVFDDGQPEVETLPNNRQNLRIMLDKKQRGGKKVTLISGFIGRNNDLEALGKQLKSACGVGGTAKDGEYRAAGTAITLLRGEVQPSDAFFIGSSYAPAENLQAAARIHRLGQNNAVVCRVFTAAGSWLDSLP